MRCLQRRGGDGLQGEAVRLNLWAERNRSSSLIGRDCSGKLVGMNDANAGPLSLLIKQVLSEPPYLRSKTKRYMDGLRKWVVEPAKNTELKENCFATALLVFAGVEGIGTLLGSEADREKNKLRFLAGLGELPEEYSNLPGGGSEGKDGNDLWSLRCALSHTASNRGWAMSKLDVEKSNHLKPRGDGVRLLHTPSFVADFGKVLDRIEDRIKNDPSLLDTVEGRIHGIPWPDEADDCETTTSTSTSPGADLEPPKQSKSGQKNSRPKRP